jgi:hypothetical protein
MATLKTTVPRRVQQRYWLVLAVIVLLALYAEFDLVVQRPHPWAADFNSYYEGVARARSGASAYFPYVIGESFFYHPFALTLLSTITWLGFTAASDLWILLNGVAYVAATILLVRHWAGPSIARPTRRFILIVLWCFAPFWHSLHMAQVNPLVMALLAAVLIWSEQGRDRPAGIALALAITLKVTPLLFLVYFLLARRWRLVLVTVLALGILTVIPMIQFGPGVLADFIVFNVTAGSGYNAWSYNHSLPTVLMRLLALIGVEGSPGVLTAVHRALVGLLAAGLLLAGARRPRDRFRQRWVFAGLVTTMTLAPPLVWYHHNVFLAIPLLAMWLSGEQRLFWWAVAIALVVQAEWLFEYGATLLMGGSYLSGVPVLAAQIALLAITAQMIRQGRLLTQPDVPNSMPS